MAKERDKNWERVLRTAIGFGKKHGRWPTRLLVDPGILEALRGGFTAEEFATLSQGVELIETPDTLRAETEDGDSYHYGESLATRLTYTVSEPRPAWLGLDLEADAEVPAARDAAELERISHAWHAAIRDKDTDTLAAIWADEYTAVGPTGRVTSKEEELDTVRSADVAFGHLTVDEIETRAIGTVAVVRSRTTAKGTYRGEPIDAQYRNTVVFALRGQRWVAVTAHSTPIE